MRVMIRTSDGLMWYDGRDFSKGLERALYMPEVLARAVARAYWRQGELAVEVVNF